MIVRTAFVLLFGCNLVSLAAQALFNQAAAPVSSKIRVDYFLADATPQTLAASYIVSPGDSATLRWSVTGTDQVYITSSNDVEQQGPLAASGTLQVCPRSGGTTYTLFAGGPPGSVPGVSLTIYVPSSPQYPAYIAPNYPTCQK